MQSLRADILFDLEKRGVSRQEIIYTYSLPFEIRRFSTKRVALSSIF